LQNYYKVFPVAMAFLRDWKNGCVQRAFGQASFARTRQKNQEKGALALALSSNRDGCRSSGIIPDRGREPVFRRLPGYLRASKAIFPQILSRRFRIAGTYCRQRWFVRYARSESLLCAFVARPDSQPARAPEFAVALPS
jgi:hypothetical protein